MFLSKLSSQVFCWDLAIHNVFLLAFTRPLDPLQPGKPGAKVLYSSRRPSLRMRTQCEAGDHLRSSDKARTQFVRFILGNQNHLYILHQYFCIQLWDLTWIFPNVGLAAINLPLGMVWISPAQKMVMTVMTWGWFYGYKSHITWRNGPN